MSEGWISRRGFLGRIGAFAAVGSVIGTGRLRVMAQSQPVGTGRRIVMSCPTADLEQFRRLADQCAELGVTHVDISDLPKARWQWFDPGDPWPNWGMLQPSFFKIAPPEELQKWIPAEYSRQCQEILAQRGEVLRLNKLKASFSGGEPMWLPEAAYKAHPEWRGPRCQYPPRARNDYYAPCIDRPEVLAMYRQAVAMLCHLVPVEEFNFLANDSGSGICWHPGLYPGTNGPEFCKNRMMSERLDGWMGAVVDGARAAGLTVDVVIAGRSLTKDSKPRQQISAGPSNYLYFSNFYPVMGVPQPFAFAEQLQEVFANPAVSARINIDSVESAALFNVAADLRKAKSTDAASRVESLKRIAIDSAGSDGGGLRLLRAWEWIGRAAETIEPINEGGPILLLGSINQRWLIRPLVPFPLELKIEEKDYYRRFQMQAWSEEIAANLMALQGNYLVNGPASTWLASRIFDKATQALTLAHTALEEAVLSAPATKQGGLTALKLRVQALILTIRNAELTCQYQEFLDRQQEAPHSRPDPKWPRLDLEEGRKIADADIANTEALIDLLESTKVVLFATAPTPEAEDVFLFHPGLVGQLRRKVEITRQHLPDHIRL